LGEGEKAGDVLIDYPNVQSQAPIYQVAKQGFFVLLIIV
jgi:hypothetical protein